MSEFGGGPGEPGQPGGPGEITPDEAQGRSDPGRHRAETWWDRRKARSEQKLAQRFDAEEAQRDPQALATFDTIELPQLGATPEQLAEGEQRFTDEERKRAHLAVYDAVPEIPPGLQGEAKKAAEESRNNEAWRRAWHPAEQEISAELDSRQSARTSEVIAKAESDMQQQAIKARQAIDAIEMPPEETPPGSGPGERQAFSRDAQLIMDMIGKKNPVPGEAPMLSDRTGKAFEQMIGELERQGIIGQPVEVLEHVRDLRSPTASRFGKDAKQLWQNFPLGILTAPKALAGEPFKVFMDRRRLFTGKGIRTRLAVSQVTHGDHPDMAVVVRYDPQVVKDDKGKEKTRLGGWWPAKKENTPVAIQVVRTEKDKKTGEGKPAFEKKRGKVKVTAALRAAIDAGDIQTAIVRAPGNKVPDVGPEWEGPEARQPVAYETHLARMADEVRQDDPDSDPRAYPLGMLPKAGSEADFESIGAQVYVNAQGKMQAASDDERAAIEARLGRDMKRIRRDYLAWNEARGSQQEHFTGPHAEVQRAAATLPELAPMEQVTPWVRPPDPEPPAAPAPAPAPPVADSPDVEAEREQKRAERIEDRRIRRERLREERELDARIRGEVEAAAQVNREAERVDTAGNTTLAGGGERALPTEGRVSWTARRPEKLAEGKFTGFDDLVETVRLDDTNFGVPPGGQLLDGQFDRLLAAAPTIQGLGEIEREMWIRDDMAKKAAELQGEVVPEDEARRREAKLESWVQRINAKRADLRTGTRRERRRIWGEAHPEAVAASVARAAAAQPPPDAGQAAPDTGQAGSTPSIEPPEGGGTGPAPGERPLQPGAIPEGEDLARELTPGERVMFERVRRARSAQQLRVVVEDAAAGAMLARADVTVPAGARGLDPDQIVAPKDDYISRNYHELIREQMSVINSYKRMRGYLMRIKADRGTELDRMKAAYEPANLPEEQFEWNARAVEDFLDTNPRRDIKNEMLRQLVTAGHLETRALTEEEAARNAPYDLEYARERVLLSPSDLGEKGEDPVGLAVLGRVASSEAPQTDEPAGGNMPESALAGERDEVVPEAAAELSQEPVENPSEASERILREVEGAFGSGDQKQYEAALAEAERLGLWRFVPDSDLPYDMGSTGDDRSDDFVRRVVEMNQRHSSAREPVEDEISDEGGEVDDERARSGRRERAESGEEGGRRRRKKQKRDRRGGGDR